MSRLILFLIAIVLILIAGVVCYVLRARIKPTASKIWNALVRRARANRYGRAVSKHLRQYSY